MNFDFSDDQRRLQEEIRRVLTDVSTSAEVRTVLEGSAPHSAQTWSHLADLGALGIALPEIYGGSGMGHLELCLVAEEAGRSLAAAPLFSTVYLAAEAINRAGSKEQKELWLPLMASGKLVATAVLDPRIQRTTAAMPLTIAANRVSGSLHAVPDGMTAQLAVLLIDDQLVALDLSAGNVTRQPVKSIDPTRPLATLHFEAAMAQSLGEKSGLQIAQSVTQGAAVLLAFEQVGGAEKALYTARDYVQERRAFGRTIGSFQAVKHKLAEMFTAIELARAHAYYGAWALATNSSELPRAAAAARVAATDAYTFAAEESLHLHGGIGFTWEMDCHLHVRRARWLGQILGSTHVWREKLATALIEEAA